MTRLLFTADLHLTTRPEHRYRWEIWDWLHMQVKQREIAHVFILGDITDRKDRHPANLVNQLIGEVRRLRKRTHVTMIMGNHDYVDPKEPFFGFLRGFYHKPRILDAEGYSFLLIPHRDHFWGGKLIRSKEAVSADFVLCHQLFKGAKIAPHVRADEGTGRRGFEKYESAKAIIAGDVHHPQRLKRLIYCGAPHPINFGDDWDPRVLYWDGSQLKSIRRTTIRRALVRVSHPTELRNYDLSEGDHARVKLEIPRAEFHDWPELQKQVKDIAQEMGIVLWGIELAELPEGRMGIDDEAPEKKMMASKPDELLAEFCNVHGVGEKEEAIGKGLL